MTHELKTLQPFFDDVRKGHKRFEIRKNDRNFKVGDDLCLKEFDGKEFTGDIWYVHINYILHGGNFGLEDGYVILGL